TTARILAKALNCPNRGPDGEPCGTCDSCREITAGTSLDVIEIDAASNNGVDEIRELRDNVRYAPTRGPYKIYIIDEVHMLSTGAFNALLKTLEEPPAHAKFFLATTDVHKVPNTILSRCQRFDLRRIGLKDIAGRLREIAEAEGWKVSEGALTAIARGAEGGLRDAESALDQIVSFRGTTIEEQDVLDVFGLVSWATVGKLAGAVLGNDARTILGILGELDDGGRDLQQVLKALTGHFRDVLLWMHAPELAGGGDAMESQSAVLKEQAAGTDAEKVLRIMDILTEAEGQMRFALSRRTVMEVALLKAGRAAATGSLDELVARLEAMEGGGAVSAAGSFAGGAPAVPGARLEAAPPKEPTRLEAASPEAASSQAGETVARGEGASAKGRPAVAPVLNVPKPKRDENVRKGDPEEPVLKSALEAFSGKLMEPMR
ncbi:MAG: DNA polymerase III subunit gamma/tau, partial [Kiritimatiellae bacterium]|nr:DNA polymerase III subunit gamma/tau [Kiritimatiellia bacterium]